MRALLKELFVLVYRQFRNAINYPKTLRRVGGPHYGNYQLVFCIANRRSHSTRGCRRICSDSKASSCPR